MSRFLADPDPQRVVDVADIDRVVSPRGARPVVLDSPDNLARA